MTCIMQQQSKSFFEIFYAIKNGFAAGKNKKFFKKVLTLALYFAIMPRIAINAIENRILYCFWLCQKQW